MFGGAFKGRPNKYGCLSFVPKALIAKGSGKIASLVTQPNLHEPTCKPDAGEGSRAAAAQPDFLQSRC